MPLLTTGKPFIRDVENHGAVAIYAPLEGGYEGRYIRRLRAKGYKAISLTARGLGDLPAYLTQVHGVRPPHLGKKTIAQDAAVGDIYFVQPIINYQLEILPSNFQGIVLWLLEGQILTKQELNYLVNLAKQQPKIKIVVEMGGERYFRWQPLQELV
ncbi:MAG: NAD(P)H-quinone oxidoreductase [Cyanobacteria bacterium J083]|nr:MAG: NAD(P)H-quinone oxidoreductase [Cyanobacteria bacterium J083]